MATVDIDCFQDEYYEVLERVARRGLKRNPRGLPTRDLGYTTIIIHDLTQPVLPLQTGRRLSRTVAAIEALQLIAGEIHPHLLIRAAPRFAEFMEHDALGNSTHFHGAYGTRIGTQMFSAIEKLESDSDTRQAVITLWDPLLDNSQPAPRDVPCTVALGLSIVDGRLRLNTLMRSNDAWLGLPTDAFVFTQLQWTIAHALGIEPDVYIHTAWSLHLYDRDIPEVDRIGPAKRREYQPTGLICGTYNAAHLTAAQLLHGKTLGVRDEGGSNDDDWLRWYVDALAPVVG